MSKFLSKKEVFLHLGIILGFFLIVVILFYPGIFQNKSLNQHDISMWNGAVKEITDYREQTGEEALWTNSMFGGMPAYLISVKYSGDLMVHLQQIISLGIPRPYSLIFTALLTFYLLLLTFKVRPLLAALGATFYATSSFIIIGLMAGHTMRIAAIAFLPLVVAGVKLIFDSKYSWGFILTAIGLALQIRVNHLQITYYLAFILLVFGGFQLFYAIKSKDFDLFKKKIPLILLAVFLAVGTCAGTLWTVMEYGKYSTRGKGELTTDVGENSSGLDKDYAFEFSNGLLEPLVLFIPNFFGGSSNESLGEDSHLAKELRAHGVSGAQLKQYTASVPTYWGDQRLTAPYYVGAIAIFLFVLGILVLDRKTKYWIVAITALGIVLSWGDSFASFNYLLFDYFPGYNKFRSVTFALIISIFGIALMGPLALSKVIELNTEDLRKKLLYAVGGTAGFAIMVALFAGMGDYKAPIDERLVSQQIPDWFINAVRSDRGRLLKMDAIRSAIFVLLSGGIIWVSLKGKIKITLGLLLVFGLVLIDSLGLDKRYLNADSFVKKRETAIQKTSADDAILRDTESGYRVLNLQNPFNEASTSYFHSSIGGYHGAKMGRYQELIENQIYPEMNQAIAGLQAGKSDFRQMQVLNMLNTKYLKFGAEKGQVIKNPEANGSVWFVNEIVTVNNPDEEMAKLGEIDTKTQAVIDKSKFTVNESLIADSTRSIVVKNYSPREIIYQSKGNQQSLAVFSEIYYAEGWKAYIDGVETDILRANYVLRALDIPAGAHEIKFRFEPRSYKIGNIIMWISNLLILAFAGMVAFMYFKQKTQTEA